MQVNFEKVSYIYQKNTSLQCIAVDDITMQIDDKKITAIIGGTGSGKSTLIQMVNALLKPMSGSVNIGNKWVITKSRRKIKNIKQLRKNVGMVFQFAEYQLFEDTVEKDITFGPKNNKIKDPKLLSSLAKKFIKIVNLPAEFLPSSPFELSGGQKRRVAIAGILALEPDVLILDEPTAGLDPHGERIILDLILDLNKKHKKTILLVTHNMDHVAEVADKVFVLDKGAVLKEGTPKKIFMDKELIKTTSLTLPYLYKIVNALFVSGISFTSNIRTISDLIYAINNKKYIIKNNQPKTKGKNE